MNWQSVVQQIHCGGIVHWFDDRRSLHRARKLGLIESHKKPTGHKYKLTAKGCDWIEGRLTIERKGNSAGMHQRATWLASLPQGVRL